MDGGGTGGELVFFVYMYIICFQVYVLDGVNFGVQSMKLLVTRD